jgi:predicted nuclease of restriction endonuclease-like (RecB) superfamily
MSLVEGNGVVRSMLPHGVATFDSTMTDLAVATNPDETLVVELRQLIHEARHQATATVNAALTLLYWRVGDRIRRELVGTERAGYGEQIVATVSHQLVAEFGRGFERSNLTRMMKFAEVFPDEGISATLSHQLSWSHFRELLPLNKPLQRDFYAEMSRLEGWSVRTLRGRIDSMLYERTALSRKPDELAKQELDSLHSKGQVGPALVLKDPYILDFLDLKDHYVERDFEDAILRELESFLLELGAGFSFVARQKRIQLDGEDFYIDLLFYNRKLKRLVVVELKQGVFRAEYKGQMELYLRWLTKYEREADEAQPLGIILCTGASRRQIELLELDAAGIHVAEYLTELPSQEVLERKLQDAIAAARLRFDPKEAV